jgi:hypothetical protein
VRGEHSWTRRIPAAADAADAAVIPAAAADQGDAGWDVGGTRAADEEAAHEQDENDDGEHDAETSELLR